MSAWRDDRFTALCADQFAQAVGVIGAIGKNLLCVQSADEVTGWRHVILLARAEHEAHRQAQGIDYGMDFRAEPTSGTTKSLGLNAPLFTRAPAAWA